MQLPRSGIQRQLHFMDDFLFVAPRGEGALVRDTVFVTFTHLGVQVCTHKTEDPCTEVTFLGIVIDKIASQLRLPADKLARLRSLFKRGRLGDHVPGRAGVASRAPVPCS